MAVMLFKHEIELALDQWLITRTFDNYFCIKILLDLYMFFKISLISKLINNYM